MPAYRFNLATGLIRYARRNVGSVRRTEDGLYHARIREHNAYGFNATDAFRKVAALAMGYPTVAALRAANSAARARNRAARAMRPFAPRPLRPSVADPAPISPEALIARIQQQARDVGETPLSAEEIRATWIRRA